MENMVNAVLAWLGKTRGDDDGAELAICALRLRQSERREKSASIAAPEKRSLAAS